MKKFAYILIIASLLYSEAFAYSPFDVLRQNSPDFTISDIYQETNSDYIAMKVCNVWWSMDRDWDIALWIKNNNSWVSTNTLIKYVRFASGDCNSYRVGTARSVWVSGGWQYNIKWWVKLSYYKSEQNSSNNSRISNIYLSAGSYNSNTYNSNIYNSNDRYYCNGSWYNYNNAADTIYYCNGNWYARGTNSNNNSTYYYNNSSDQYYCGGKRYTYWVNDTSYYCDGSRHSRNSSINYNSNNYNSNDKYYCNGNRYNYNSTADTAYYCNGTRYPRNGNNNYYNYNNNYDKYYCNGNRYNYNNTSDTSYYCNGSWYSRYTDNNNYYNNSYYNSNYYNNDYNYNKADLGINMLYLNKFNRQIVARICNSWWAMLWTYNVKTTFYSKNTWRTIVKNSNVNLGQNSCTNEEINVDVFDLWFYYNWNIEVTANIQVDNYPELNINNNSKTTSIAIDYN